MISQTAEYALRAAVCLARDDESRLTRPEIAALTGLPAGYLSKVMRELTRSGVVDSQRGCSGGFWLARPPEEINLLEIINAVDPLGRHLRIHGEALPGDDLAALDRRLDAVLHSLERHLEQTSLADVVRSAQPLGPGLERCPLC